MVLVCLRSLSFKRLETIPSCVVDALTMSQLPAWVAHGVREHLWVMSTCKAATPKVSPSQNLRKPSDLEQNCPEWQCSLTWVTWDPTKQRAHQRTSWCGRRSPHQGSDLQWTAAGILRCNLTAACFRDTKTPCWLLNDAAFTVGNWYRKRVKKLFNDSTLPSAKIENSTIEAHRLKPAVENSCLQKLRLCYYAPMLICSLI